jgi:hypothetical protein
MRYALLIRNDENAAIGVATRIPGAWYGTIEVRPVRETEAS